MISLILPLILLAEESGLDLPEPKSITTTQGLLGALAALIGYAVLREVVGRAIKKPFEAQDELEKERLKKDGDRDDKLIDHDKRLDVLKENDMRHENKLEGLTEKIGALTHLHDKLEQDVNGIAMKFERQIRELRTEVKEELGIQRKSLHDLRNEMVKGFARIAEAIEKK